MSREELRRQALRINQRYIDEVVCAYDLCPWAKGVSEGRDFRREVIFDSGLQHSCRDDSEALIECIAASAAVDVALVIFPRLHCTHREFRSFVGQLEQAHAAKHPRHALPLAMAAFHPMAEADFTSPARLVPFIRKSPDPTIQLVRRSTMDKVRERENEGSVFAESLASFMPLMGKAPAPSVSQSIAETNYKRLETDGVESLQSIHEDIAKDREASYPELSSDAEPG